jgi:hypothetical protein
MKIENIKPGDLIVWKSPEEQAWPYFGGLRARTPSSVSLVHRLGAAYGERGGDTILTRELHLIESDGKRKKVTMSTALLRQNAEEIIRREE